MKFDLVNKKVLFFFVIFAAVFFMYLFNRKTLLISDDFTYHFMYSRYPNSNTKLIENPLDIFKSMTVHWKMWGGRVVVHFLLQLFLFLGITVFNFINSVMFALLGFLIYKFVNSSEKYNTMLLAFIYLMIFFLAPSPWATLMWKSGSVNYLWSTVLVLIMAIIYKKQFDVKDSIKDDKKHSILIFIYGLISGCTNESLGCALIVLEFFYIILYRIKYKKVPSWAICGLIGSIIGYIFLIIAPGNYKRTLEMYPNYSLSINYLINRIINITQFMLARLGYVIILIVATFLINIKRMNFRDLNNQIYNQLILFIAGIISIYCLILSPAYPTRAFFYSFIFFLIIIAMNFNNIFLVHRKVKKFCLVIIAGMFTFFLFDYSKQYNYINKSYNIVSKQIEFIKEQKRAGVEDIYINGMYFITNNARYDVFAGCMFVTDSTDNWLNSWVSEYYGINSIIAIDDEQGSVFYFK